MLVLREIDALELSMGNFSAGNKKFSEECKKFVVVKRCPSDKF
jgi:hypothetical protein